LFISELSFAFWHPKSAGKSVAPSPSLSNASLHSEVPQSAGQLIDVSSPSQTLSPQFVSSLSLASVHPTSFPSINPSRSLSKLSEPSNPVFPLLSSSSSLFAQPGSSGKSIQHPG